MEEPHGASSPEWTTSPFLKRIGWVAAVVLAFASAGYLTSNRRPQQARPVTVTPSKWDARLEGPVMRLQAAHGGGHVLATLNRGEGSFQFRLLALQNWQGAAWRHDARFPPAAPGPMGRFVVTASPQRVPLQWKLMDAGPGLPLGTEAESHTDRITAIGISPDGAMAFSGSSDGTVRMWSVEGRRLMARWDLGSTVDVLSISPRGLVAAVTREGTVFYFRAEFQKARIKLDGAPGSCADAAAAGGDQAVAALCDGQLVLWRLEDKTGQPSIREGPLGQPTALATSADGRRIAVVANSRVQLWTYDGQTLRRAKADLRFDRETPTAVAFLGSAGEEKLIVGFESGLVRASDPAGGGL
ncbi:MAG: WD40 repeat domain-containing protein [Paludibaculum sp.]